MLLPTVKSKLAADLGNQYLFAVDEGRLRLRAARLTNSLVIRILLRIWAYRALA